MVGGGRRPGARSLTMDSATAGLLCVGVLVLLLALGVPVAIAMALAGIGGMVLTFGWTFALLQVQTLPFAVGANYAYAVLPLFVLMGSLAGVSGITTDLYLSAHRWFSGVRGGLYLATIAGSAGFAAASGSTVVNAVVFTRLALPEMMRFGYSRSLSVGCIAASGTFAAMIPPSITMVLYAIITEQSVGALLVAGVVPGILSAVIYGVGVSVLVRARPHLAPAVGTPSSLAERLRSLRGVWGILVLLGLVLGGIYTGWFPPSAAGAVGAAGTFLIAFARQPRCRWLPAAVRSAVSVTCVIFTILIGGLLFSRMLVTTGLIEVAVETLSGLGEGPAGVLTLIAIMYLVLGCFLDTTSMMIITLPVVFPVVTHFGIDPVWFGIILVKVIEIAVISPPVGLNLYAVLSGAEGQVTSRELFVGVVPFLVMDLLTLALLILFPALSLWLPARMAG